MHLKNNEYIREKYRRNIEFINEKGYSFFSYENSKKIIKLFLLNGIGIKYYQIAEKLTDGRIHYLTGGNFDNLIFENNLYSHKKSCIDMLKKIEVEIEKNKAISFQIITKDDYEYIELLKKLD